MQVLEGQRSKRRRAPAALPLAGIIEALAQMSRNEKLDLICLLMKAQMCDRDDALLALRDQDFALVAAADHVTAEAVWSHAWCLSSGRPTKAERRSRVRLLV